MELCFRFLDLSLGPGTQSLGLGLALTSESRQCGHKHHLSMQAVNTPDLLFTLQ